MRRQLLIGCLVLFERREYRIGGLGRVPQFPRKVGIG